MTPIDLILVAERDETAAALRDDLLEPDCSVRVVLRDGVRPEHLAARPDPLVLLHIEAAAAGALAWCRDLRRALPAGRICVLFEHPDELAQIVALEMGADAVLVRPVSRRRLHAQLHALSRRLARDLGRHRVGDLEICEGTREARIGDVELDLTTLEFDLLVLFARHIGRTLSRDRIKRDLRGLPHDARDRSIDLAVVRLRRKLGDDAQRPRYVKTVRGAGYLLAADAS